MDNAREAFDISYAGTQGFGSGDISTPVEVHGVADKKGKRRREVRVKELSRLLQLEPATLSPLLKRLEASGYVERPRARTDERSLAITLTPAGWRLRNEAEKIPAAIVGRLGMEVSELQHLHQVLTRVIGAANEANVSYRANS